MNPLAAIHVRKKQLGLDDDTYRAMLERVTGKRSAGEMSHAERLKVVAEMDRQGGASARTSKSARKGFEGRFAKKLQALWIAAWNLGLVRDRTDAALVSFIRRQTGLDHVRFLHDPADAKKAIEALKGWIARDGGVEWGWSHGYDWLTHDAGKVAWAQFCLLWPGATLVGNRYDFYREACRAIGREVPAAGMGSLTPADWRAVMNAFGARVRQAKS